MANAKRDRAALVSAGKDTKDIDDRIKTSQETHARNIREFVDKEKAARSEIGLMTGEQREKDMGRAWMAMPERQRMQIFMKMMRGAKTDQERAAVMSSAGA